MAGSVPARYTSGLSTDYPWQPLALYGMRNPFLYHEWEDDFDDLENIASAYTATKTGNGTIAATAGDGGLALFTTNSSAPAATDICSIQLPAAGFKAVSGNKMFYLTRFQIADITNAGVIAGFIQTTTTPFTVVDGIYLLKASGATALTLNVTISSATTSVTIPSSIVPLANNTNIDMGFSLDRSGILRAYVGASLVGYVPQSGVGSSTPRRGPQYQFAATAPTLPSANLNPTLAIRSGTTASTTMTADFMLAAKER